MYGKQENRGRGAGSLERWREAREIRQEWNNITKYSTLAKGQRGMRQQKREL